MHVMRDTEAWLSWLEHTVHIREVTGSSPVASTTFYQSAPVADWFFIFLEFFSQNINDFTDLIAIRFSYIQLRYFSLSHKVVGNRYAVVI